MDVKGIALGEAPVLTRPVLVAGFNGWGNALDVSRGMAAYLSSRMGATEFARLLTDTYFRYDEYRPVVKVSNGVLERLSPPGGSFRAALTPPDESDVIILEADEPNMNWNAFAADIVAVCQRFAVTRVITLGSLYDNVYHEDETVSAMAGTREDFESLFPDDTVKPINYNGPSAVHSAIQLGCINHGIDCVSLWAHCPFYLQGIVHYGLMAALGEKISAIGNFFVDTKTLKERWAAAGDQVQALVDENPNLSGIIEKLKDNNDANGSRVFKRPPNLQKGQKVIDLMAFLDSGKA